VDVWRRNLRSQCILNNLFAPSYSNLSTLSDYRDACEAGLRFARNVELVGRQNSNDEYSDLNSSSSGSQPSSSTSAKAVEHRRKIIEFFETGTNKLDSIKDIRIVPGGRYLLVLLPGRLSILDMASLDEEVLNYPLADGAECIMHFGVVGTDKIQLILDVWFDTPQEFWDDGIICTRDLFEIYPPVSSTPSSDTSLDSHGMRKDETASFEVCKVGRLQFIMSEYTTSLNRKHHIRVDGTRVLFFFTLPVIVIWDYAANEFAAWGQGWIINWKT
jgi:hypothetical protein